MLLSRHTLLLLVAVVLGYARLEQLARLVVFGQNDDFRFLGLRSHKSAEHGATGANHRAMPIAPTQARIRAAARWREKRTLTTMPLQKPVPLSNQSLFLSSYTLTRLRSLAGGATKAIVGGEAYKHSGAGKHALQSVARGRDALRSAWGQLAAGAEAWVGARGSVALADDDRIGGWACGGLSATRRAVARVLPARSRAVREVASREMDGAGWWWW